MNWEEKIKKGMELIKEGCSEQTELLECYNCPFITFCELMEDNNYEAPNEEF